eukprot:NODE_669_length_4885_cov_0.982449.p4 type:complete len:107 gc:universal NODE_669_length_4885_cov_0.982449:483-803(+)
MMMGKRLMLMERSEVVLLPVQVAINAVDLKVHLVSPDPLDASNQQLLKDLQMIDHPWHLPCIKMNRKKMTIKHFQKQHYPPSRCSNLYLIPSQKKSNIYFLVQMVN